MAAAMGNRLPEATVLQWFHALVDKSLARVHSLTRHALVLMPLLAAVTLPGDAYGDSHRFTIELRAGAASATARLADRALEVGLGIDAQLSWAMTPYAALYGGYGVRELPSDGGDKAVLKHEGYVLGVELHWRERHEPVGFRLAAGLTYDRLESDDDPELALADDSGAGWEVGAAVLVPLAGGWSLAPGLRYRSLSSALAFDDDATVDDDVLELVMLEVGALWSF